MSRRILVVALLLIAVIPFMRTAGAQAAPPAVSQTVQSGSSIVGSWLVSISPDPIPETQVMSFTSDGIVIATNTPTQPVLPGQEPPGVSRTYSTNDLGVWSQTGDQQFQMTIVSAAYDDTGAVVDIDKAILSFTLSADGSSFSGQFRVEVSDPMGNLLFASPGPIAQFTATRIVVEPY